MRLLVEPEHVLMVARAHYAFAALTVPLLIQFIVVLLRLESRRRSLVAVAWCAGVVFAPLAVATPHVISGLRTYSWGYEPAHGLLGTAFLLWLAVLAAVVISDALRVLAATLPHTVERRRVGLFTWAVVILCLTVVDLLAAAGLPLYPVGHVTALAFVLMTAWCTYRYGLIEVTAQLAAGELAAMTRGALLILDRDGVIQVVNDGARAVLGITREHVGRRAREFLGDAFDVAGLASLARLDAADAEREVRLRALHTGRWCQFALSVSATRDAHGRDAAFVCVLRDMTDRRRAEDARAAQGLRDRLTGLPARELFLELVDGEGPADGDALCFIGVDRMRMINEDLGHPVGDRVLAELGRRLREAGGADDIVGRIGGDEFGVLLRGIGDESGVDAAAAQLHAALGTRLGLVDHVLHVSTSVGVVPARGVLLRC